MITVGSLPEWCLQVRHRVEITEGPYEGLRGKIVEIRTYPRWFAPMLVVQEHNGSTVAALPEGVKRA